MLSILFPNKSPKFNGYEFDATLEDSFEASIELTKYPVESGVKVNDHRIINPMKYYITGAIGSKPLRPLITGVTDFTALRDVAIGAATNVLRKNPYVALAAGLTTGFLSSSQETRASASLKLLLDLMVSGLPFDVDAVDIQLKNMVITKVSRAKTPEDETGLIVVVELQELIMLQRLATLNQPRPDQLPANDPSQTGAAGNVNRGQQNAGVVTSSVQQAVVQVRTL